MECNSSSTTTFKPLNPDSLSEEAGQVVNLIAHYYKDVSEYPVKSQVKPGYLKKLLPQTIPDCPESLEVILYDVKTKIIPGLTHWQSPNFFAYFPASASNAAFLGDMLCTGLSVVGFNWMASPAATELESMVIDWMGEMLELPKEFLFSGGNGGGGVLYSTVCEGLLCTLVAARDKVLNALGAEKITKLVVYASDQTHFSLDKAARLVGIPPYNIRAIPTSSSNDFALSPHDVRAAMKRDLIAGYVPLYLCATIGTTASCAVDPIEDLGHVAKEFDVWFHIDAAYAGNACICPEYRHLLNGVELADSVNMNLHKWFLTNVDCSCMWLRNSKAFLDSSLSTSPEILRNKASTGLENIDVVVDYKDWQISLSRRFRSIKLWLVIRRYGLSNLRTHIRSDIEMAKHFECLVRSDDKFEVVVPRTFALVCFRLLSPRGDEEECDVINQKLLEAINSSGQAYVTHAVLGDKFVIRCAIGATLTDLCHVEKLWKLIQEKASLVLCKKTNDTLCEPVAAP